MHGLDAVRDVARASVTLFSKRELSELSDDDLAVIFSDVPSVTVERSALASAGGCRRWPYRPGLAVPGEKPTG